jgi:hypothetical protein
MIALIGSEGSMGLRYQAILKHLKQPHFCFDKIKQPDEKKMLQDISQCDRVIIATPTHTHADYLRALLPMRKPILCEKPITKDLDEITELHSWCAENNYSYNMVMQYKELDITTEPERVSGYNYFRHGSDGLAWDCIQIIGLAKGPVVLGEDMPIWMCSVNGRYLNIKDMDQAYVHHVQKWLNGTLNQSMDEILNMHTKVHEYLEKQVV